MGKCGVLFIPHYNAVRQLGTTMLNMMFHIPRCETASVEITRGDEIHTFHKHLEMAHGSEEMRGRQLYMCFSESWFAVVLELAVTNFREVPGYVLDLGSHGSGRGAKTGPSSKSQKGISGGLRGILANPLKRVKNESPGDSASQSSRESPGFGLRMLIFDLFWGVGRDPRRLARRLARRLFFNSLSRGRFWLLCLTGRITIFDSKRRLNVYQERFVSFFVAFFVFRLKSFRRTFLREAKPAGFQIGGVPLFFGKGPDCVADRFGTVPRRCKRPRKRKRTNRENPRTNPGQIGKIPEKKGKSQKDKKRTKKGRTSPDRETPPVETPQFSGP